jgi:hypothetical protein
MNPTRRGFLRAAASFLAAPAIVRVSSIMPVKAPPLKIVLAHEGTFQGPLTLEVLREAKRLIKEMEPNPFMIDGRAYWVLSTHPAAARHGTPAGRTAAAAAA